jgi:hypothetical protein
MHEIKKVSASRISRMPAENKLETRNLQMNNLNTQIKN